MAGDELEKCGWESHGSGGFARRPRTDGLKEGGMERGMDGGMDGASGKARVQGCC